MGNKEYELDLSLDADNIVDQLGRQLIFFTTSKALELDGMNQYREHIGVLRRDNLLTDNEAEKAYKRLKQKIKGIINGKTNSI